MSLYQDAAAVLSSEKAQGSLKSRIYGDQNLRSKPGQLFALVSQTAKYNVFLKEVIERSEILQHEPKLAPLLSLLLIHDHFFSKNGIAAPVKHPLRQAVNRHKSRLQSEFTRARVKRGCGSIEALKEHLTQSNTTGLRAGPRWIRVNSLKAKDLESCLRGIPKSSRASDRSQIANADRTELVYLEDCNISFVVAVNGAFEVVKTQAYQSGAFIIQDKASCFPAYLLLQDEGGVVGDVIDACAAPGNKTTHLAAVMHEQHMRGKVFACERDAARSKTLQMMVSRAGAMNVEILAKQDFLALNPHDKRFEKATHFLLDPSCSGSGIVGREDIPELALPIGRSTVRDTAARTPTFDNDKKSKKMQDNRNTSKLEPKVDTKLTDDDEQVPHEEARSVSVDADRLQKLAGLQSRIVEHAMKFPAARKITYSTCSVHTQENEEVVAVVLASLIAHQRGWRVLRRDEQPHGLRNWRHRGVNIREEHKLKLTVEQMEACIRCYPGDNENTMGFFVCGFTRSDDPVAVAADDGEMWEGFG